MPLDPTLAGAIGAVGGGIVYFLSYRAGQIQKLDRKLVGEVLVFIAFSAFLVALVFKPENEINALFLGAGWPNIFGGVIQALATRYSDMVKEDVKGES